MKKITLFLALCSFAFAANAQVILDETFDYTESSLTSVASWTNTLSANGTVVGTIGNLSSEPLSYGDANGMYALSGIGKLVTSDYTSGGSDFKVYKAIPATTSGVIYLSLLFRPGVAQNQTNSEIMCLSIAGSNGPKVLIGKGVDITKFRFATTRASSSSADYKWGATEFADVTQTFLLVVKYDWTAKTASLFVNPTIGSATEPTAEVIDNNGGPGAKDVAAPIDGFRFRCNGASAAKFQVSGVRVSTSWAAAVGKMVAALSTPVVGTASNVTNEGFTANWTVVSNALGYDVLVYNSGNLVKIVALTGQSVNSTIITGLNSNTAYTYKIVANSDKVNFGNSLPSSDSPVVTTTGLSVPTASAATEITTTGFKANWASVANATGYNVLVYLGSTLVNTLPVSGQGTAFLAITGLQMGTTYTYKVVALGSVNSSASAAITCNTLSANVSSITTDFGNATVWGVPVPAPSTNLPANGNYPVWQADGFIFNKALVYAGSSTGVNGETHTNVISFDKLITASVQFPTVSSCVQIETHAFSGSDLKSIVLEELNPDGTSWTILNTYTTNKLEATYIENVTRNAPATFRLRNNGTTSMNVSQIIVRATVHPTALAAPATPANATNLIAGGFTASWTPVANAVGYIVSVWNYGKPVNKNFTVTGQTSSTYNVIGLDSAAMCTYKVAAVGDGITYSNSLLSAASTSFSITAGLLAVDNLSVSNLIWSNGKTINTPESGEIEIFNLQGLKVAGAKNVTVLHTNLNLGLYIVKFTTQSGKVFTNKVRIY